MCVAPLYGDEPKWLMFIEMIEHYKLQVRPHSGLRRQTFSVHTSLNFFQGVEHFYNYIHEISDYDSKVIDYYAGLGIVENHYLLEKGLRTDRHRHINEVVVSTLGVSQTEKFGKLEGLQHLVSRSLKMDNLR